MDKKQVQEAINRIDQALATLHCDRATHIALVNDLRQVQFCCMEYFEVENERTYVNSNCTPTGDENSEGSGDGIPGSERDESGDAPSQP